MTAEDKRKEKLRQNILICVKANNIPVTGDFWLMLIFRTESELKVIAQDLHIVIA